MRIELCRALREPGALALALGAPTAALRAGVEIAGIATDSGEVTPGDVFLALLGKRHSGWDFSAEALARGASGIIAPRSVPLPAGEYSSFRVKEPAAAVLAAAAHYRRQLPGRVLAISGSTGKTTLKEGLFHVLSQVGVTRRSEGNYNSDIGMPLSLLSMEPGEYYVLELGISHPGEMEPLSRALAPDLAILTNVGSAHIGSFGSHTRLLAEKLRIASGIAKGGSLLLPEGLPLPTDARENIRYDRVGCGMECRFRAENIHMDAGGVRMDLHSGEKSYRGISYTVPGSVGVSFLSFVGAVGLLLGIPQEQLERGLAVAGACAPRLRRVFLGGRMLLNDTYNASPESMVTALEVLELLAGERECVAVLGDMLELGALSVALHGAVGECVGRGRVERLFTYGEQALEIARGACRAGMPEPRISSFLRGEERALATALLTETARDAVILFKASRGMRLESVLEEMKGRA